MQHGFFIEKVLSVHTFPSGCIYCCLDCNNQEINKPLKIQGCRYCRIRIFGCLGLKVKMNETSANPRQGTGYPRRPRLLPLGYYLVRGIQASLKSQEGCSKLQISVLKLMHLMDFKPSKGLKAAIQTGREYLNVAIISRHMLHIPNIRTFHSHSMWRGHLKPFRLLFPSAEWGKDS